MNTKEAVIEELVLICRSARDTSQLSSLRNHCLHQSAILMSMGSQNVMGKTTILLDHISNFSRLEDMIPLTIILLAMQVRSIPESNQQDIKQRWLGESITLLTTVCESRSVVELEQILHFFHKEFASIALTTAKYAISLKVPQVVTLLEGTVEMCSPRKSCLTASHVAFVQVCTFFRWYQYASRWIRENPVFSIDPPLAHVSTEDYLSYQYHAALCFIAQKEYKLSLEYLSNCITIPSLAPSAISLLATRTARLVALLHNGRPFVCPKFASSCVKGKQDGHSASILSQDTSYKFLQDAFTEGDAVALQKAIKSNQSVLSVDGNLGLAYTLVEAQARHNMRKLTDTYIRLSLSDMATKLGLEGVVEAERLLCDLVASGHIAATIDQCSGTVHFQDRPNSRLSRESNLIATLNETITLNEKLEDMKKELYSSPVYLLSLTSSSRVSAFAEAVQKDATHEMT